MNKIPITIISGFEQTGKTSVLLALLRERNVSSCPAVIMNDLSEKVTGTDAVREALGTDRQLLLELPNGCICCTLSHVLLHAVEQLTQSTVDHLYIEGNATAEPLLIKRLLEESTVSDQLCVTSMITVIDASTFLQDFLSTDALHHRGLVALSHDDRIVSEVLAEQIESATTLVITKADLVSEADVALLQSVLGALNPTANIVVHGAKRANVSSDALKKYVFKADRPFHPNRLHAALHTDAFSAVLRARGIAWIATRQQYKVRWSQTGSMCSFESDGHWWHPGSSAEEEIMNMQWFDSCGNRYSEMEFIGTDVDVRSLRKVLTGCLLTDLELALEPDLWAHFEDPFEDWEEEMDRSLFVVRETVSDYLRLNSRLCT